MKPQRRIVEPDNKNAIMTPDDQYQAWVTDRNLSLHKLLRIPDHPSQQFETLFAPCKSIFT